jgi:hypothetical protein
VILAVGLAASEAAVAGSAYLLAYEALGRRDEALRARIRALIPAGTALVAYFLIYRIGHFGAHGSGGYHDPVGDPARFLLSTAVHTPILLGDALLSVPSELALRGGTVPLVLVGAVAMAACAWAYRRHAHTLDGRERAALRWLVPGALVATLVVGGSGIIGGRLLVVPDLGLSALVGVLIRHGLGARFAHTRIGARAVAAVLVLTHFLGAPLLARREVQRIAERGRAAEGVARDVESAARDARVALVFASDPNAFLYARGVLADTSERRICWEPLAATPTSYRLRREDARTLVLDTLDRPLVGTLFETLFRAPNKGFAVGDEVDQCGTKIRVAAAPGGRPTRLEIRLDRVPADVLALLHWRDGHLVRVALPNVGETAELSWQPGPTERDPAHHRVLD